MLRKQNCVIVRWLGQFRPARFRAVGMSRRAIRQGFAGSAKHSERQKAEWEYKAMPVTDRSVPSLLQERADQQPDSTAYTYIDYGSDPKGIC